MLISIITAIYNQLDMNRIYYDSICKHTDSDWELIIIDNASDDGSFEFFNSLNDPRVKVIRNDGNYSYPYCQNLGIKHAEGDVLAFLNNDILLSQHWDTRVLKTLGHNGYEALTLSSNDNMPDSKLQKKYSRRYKRFKYPMLKLFGNKKWVLKLLPRLTYGNWENFCEKVWSQYGSTLKRGFAGSAVIMTRYALEQLGEWDPSQQGADFDLYLRSCCRWEEKGDIRPLSILGGVYHHHYSRLTFKAKYPPFKDSADLIPLEQKWPESIRHKYL